MPNGGFKTVRVPDLGTVRFPASMSDAEIESAIRNTLSARQGIPKPPGFFGGVAEMVLPTDRPSDVLAGPAYAVRHPIESVKLTVGAMKEASAEMRRRSQEAMERGETTRAIGYELAAAIPLVGPAAGVAGARLAEGEIARGLGNVAGLLAPTAVGKLGRRIPKSRPLPTVPLTLGEKTGSRPALMIEATVERTLPGSIPFQKFRVAQQRALIEGEAQRVVSDISKFEGSTEELGVRAVKEIGVAEERLKAAPRAIYEEVDGLVGSRTERIPTKITEPSRLVSERGEPLTIERRVLRKAEVGGVQPETVVLKRFAIPLLRRINREAKLIHPTELARTKGLLETIVRAPKRLPFTAFHDARSDLLRIVRSIGDPIPGKAGGVAKRLSSLTDDAMMQAAENSGIEGLSGKIREANALWRDLTETFNESIVTKMLDAPAEKLPGMLQAASLDGIRRVRSVLPRKTFDAMAGKVAQGLLNDAIQGELSAAPGVMRAGEVLGGPAAQTLPKLRGDRLRVSLERLGEPRLQEIFGDPNTRALFQLASTAENVGLRTSGWIPAIMNSYMLYGGLKALITGDVGAATGAGAMAVVLYVTGRLMTRTEGTHALRNLVIALGRGDRSKAVFWGNRAAALASQNLQRETEEKLRRDTRSHRLSPTDVMMSAKRGEIDHRAPRRILGPSQIRPLTPPPSR